MVNRIALIAELNKRKSVASNLFDFKEFCFDRQWEFLRSDGPRFRTAVCSRRAGKCIKSGTYVKTPTGSKKIENLKPGDVVYGYNLKGEVEECNVIHLWDQGVKEVVDLIHSRKIVATCTLDHKWLAHNTYKDARTVKKLKDFNCRDNLGEEYFPIPGGPKEVREAYAIGALLGDGCCRESGIVISSGDEIVVKESMYSLNADSYKKLHKNNYSWRIIGSDNSEFYNNWCKSRYAHQKIFNLEEVRTWNRKSQLNLIAGLIDSDGNVEVRKDGRLVIRLSMQAKEVIYNTKALLLDLFQCTAQVVIDDREKYKNGPVYTLIVSNNKFSKRILKELPTKVERKQWKNEYLNLVERNSHPKYTGFKTQNKRLEQCYDITVDNDTNLYLLANGLITHNTVGIAGDLIDSCLNATKSTCLYITITKDNVRRILWGDLKNILSENKIICKTNDLRLEVHFPNGSRILTGGAKDRLEIEKFRGLKLLKVFIDECQSMRQHIKGLIDEILIPALRDLRGSLYLTGTPGPVKAGPFYEYSHNNRWANFKWTAFENPYMHDPENGKDLNITLKEERELRNIDESDPGYQRETYGTWIEDTESLVFKFNDINHFEHLPNEKFEYIMGIDIGYEDSDAIAILAYSYDSNKVYVVDEVENSKQDITDLANSIKALRDKYKPIKMVIDAGALGKKITEELKIRHQLPIEAADKARKFEYIEFLNADLRKNVLRAKKDSLFAQDSKLVMWDRSNPLKPKISTVYHSDIGDAVLYAYRECRHFLYKEVAPTPKRDSNAYMDELEKKESENMERFNEDPESFLLEKEFEADLEDFDGF